MFFETKDSSAIKEIEVNDNDCTIVFNSSDKVYNYFINSEEFVEKLQDTIAKEESVGSFINKAIKDKLIEEITTDITVE
jgi:hypothetical protein